MSFLYNLSSAVVNYDSRFKKRGGRRGKNGKKMNYEEENEKSFDDCDDEVMDYENEDEDFDRDGGDAAGLDAVRFGMRTSV